MKKKSLISAALLIALALSAFSGCGKQSENSDLSADASADKWDGEGGCYKKAALGGQNFFNGAWGGENTEYLICGAMDSSGKADFAIADARGNSIYKSSCDNLLKVTGCSDGFWTAEVEPDIENGQIVVLKKLSSGGIVTRTVNLDDVAPMTAFVEDMATDKADNLYILAGGTLFAIDSDGRLLSELSFNSGFPMQLAVNSLGEVCALAQTAEGKALYSLDPETGKTEKLTQLGEYDIHDGCGSFYLYLTNSRGLWVMTSPDDKEYVPVIIWAECSMDFIELSDLFPLAGGEFLCVDKKGAYTLTPALPNEIVHKTVLTLACISPLEITSDVSRFNTSDERYTVVVEDYSQGGVVSRPDALNRLNTDLIAGNIPDMLLFTDIPVSPYTQKGLMADMYGFMDADPDVGRDDFILLDKLETDGALYYVANLSAINLVYGRYSDFGERCGWTIEEFMALQSSMKHGESVMPKVSRETFLEYLVRLYLQSAVDWKSSTCDFENDDFISILNAAKSIDPAIEYNYGMFYSQMSDEMTRAECATALGTLSGVSAIAQEEKLAGEKLSIIGWPTVDGSCGTLIETLNPIGICQGGKNKEGAWEFVKYMLDRGISCIPLSRERLNEEIEGCIVRKGRLIGVPPLMTWEDADRLLEFLDELEVVNEENDDIMNIILDEAEGYFAGVRSAGETAKLVNSRAGILLAERS